LAIFVLYITCSNSLWENRSSPNANEFAECNLSDTWQTIYLPSANEKHSKKKTLGKQGCLPSAKGWALGKQHISEFSKIFKNSKQSLKIMRFGKMS